MGDLNQTAQVKHGAKIMQEDRPVPFPAYLISAISSLHRHDQYLSFGLVEPETMASTII
jgi:hypothetical protein